MSDVAQNLFASTGFSCVKRLKNDWRSSLTTQMMNHLLCVSLEGPTLEEYDAERAVHLWWTRGQRARRPQFAAPALPAEDHADQPEEDELLDFCLRHNNMQLGQ